MDEPQYPRERVEYVVVLELKSANGDPRKWNWSDLVEDEYAVCMASEKTGRRFVETEDGELVGS